MAIRVTLEVFGVVEMKIDPQALMQKILALPEDRRAEVADFVDSMAGELRRRDALKAFLAVAPAIEAAGLTPPTEEEILAEVKAVRREMRRERAPDS
jgi:hypothetical protein